MNRRQTWGRDFAAPLNTLQSELHRLYEHYRNVGGLHPGAASEPASAWTPALDLFETPEEIGIRVDLPGVDPSGVDLSISGRTLTLRGDKPREPASAPGRTLERPHGPFLREVELPADVDLDAIQAESRNGVLSVRLPKVAATHARTIPIQEVDDRPRTPPA